jgi:HK97 family phage major capsid protein
MKKYKLLKAWMGQKIGAVLEMSEADAKGLITEGYLEAYVETPVVETPTEKALSDLLVKFQEGLTETINNVTKAVAKSVGAKGKGGVIINGGTARNDDDATFGYKGLGEFSMDVRTACAKNGAKTPERLIAVVEKAPTGMSENQGDDAGYLIPTQLGAGVYERAFPENSLVTMCDGYSLTGNSIEFPGLIDDNRATGSRWGGIQGFWLEEATQITNSRPKFTNIKVKLHKLAVLVYVTDELLIDSPLALEQFISKKAGDEINFLTGDAMINGAGGVKPLGILNSPAMMKVPRAAANKIGFNDIITMWNRCWAPSRNTAVWLINQEVEPQLDQLTFLVKNVAGTENVGGWPLYVPNWQINGSPQAMLKGRPVIPCEFSAALGSYGDIMLVDMAQYILATKSTGVQSAMSIHLRFDYDETAFRFTYRVDGQPWWNKPVTPFKGAVGTQFSPFVALQ